MVIWNEKNIDHFFRNSTNLNSKMFLRCGLGEITVRKLFGKTATSKKNMMQNSRPRKVNAS